MKKYIISAIVLFSTFIAAQSQKFAFIDSEYILKNVPAYESAQDQLNQVSKKWQQEVDNLMTDVKTLYANYQKELVFLAQDQKVKRENEIVEKEKAAQDLRKKYFGPEGELFKKRESLIRPIQDEIFSAIKDYATEKGYAMILDKATSPNVIYSDPKLDISDQILQKLGYTK